MLFLIIQIVFFIALDTLPVIQPQLLKTCQLLTCQTNGTTSALEGKDQFNCGKIVDKNSYNLAGKVDIVTFVTSPGKERLRLKVMALEHHLPPQLPSLLQAPLVAWITSL